ncbi:serine hydrolase domain-containing protein [Maribacter aestuarii]|uniref:serine hydrolase domain-containing protein n=1 Tax=Maribacter aestuarii TaxID=1130723 RepID=UPI0025A54A35|nr:serine hydrolase domain-containing protein [Maribacter aestuarii]
MNPIKKFILNLFASKHFLGSDSKLMGLLRADTILQNLIVERRVPGLAITVIKEGEVVFRKGFGYADLDTKKFVDPQNSIFRIASVSKPIAATALAQMVSEGIIDLDASFYKYVPYYPKKKWDFTIRNLAGHTAGIRGYRGTEYGLNQPYSIKESIEVFAADDLLFEPGTGYFYNSYDWVLISLAMQEASGIPFEQYVHQTVLKPLGMSNTFTPAPIVKSIGAEFGSENNKEFSTPREQTEEISSFYTKNRDGFRKAISVNNFYKLAGGGYLSTSSDIAKLGQAYLEKKVSNDSVLGQFLTSEIINGEPTYYGLGWQVSEDIKGRPYFGHIGNGIGGYSNFFVYPNEKMVFSILVNCTNPNVQDELDEIIQIFLTENFNDSLS